MTADGPRAGGPRLCPHCGAAMAPDQDWCLECGTAATTRVMAPPSWKVPAAVIGAVLIAFAIAVVIAVSVLSGDAERSVSPVDPAANISSQPSEPPPPAQTQPEDDAAATAATGDTSPSGEEDSEGATGASGATGATGAEEAGDVAIWDEDKEAYTVVLITSDRDGAEKVAKEIAKSSGSRTGVFDTTKYDFFSPNLWVAWAGEFEEKTDAQKLADEIRRKDGRSGYVTLVKKK